MGPLFPGWLGATPICLNPWPSVLPMTVTAPRSPPVGGCFLFGEVSLHGLLYLNIGSCECWEGGPGSGDKKPQSQRLKLALWAAITTNCPFQLRCDRWHKASAFSRCLLRDQLLSPPLHPDFRNLEANVDSAASSANTLRNRHSKVPRCPYHLRDG